MAPDTGPPVPGRLVCVLLRQVGRSTPGQWLSDVLFNQSLAGLFNRFIRFGLPMSRERLRVEMVSPTEGGSVILRVLVFGSGFLLPAITARWFRQPWTPGATQDATAAGPIPWDRLQIGAVRRPSCLLPGATRSRPIAKRLRGPPPGIGRNEAGIATSAARRSLTRMSSSRPEGLRQPVHHRGSWRRAISTPIRTSAGRKPRVPRRERATGRRDAADHGVEAVSRKTKGAYSGLERYYTTPAFRRW